MKILVTNLPGVEVDDKGRMKHYAKAGSRWPMTIGHTKSVDYYAFPFWLAYTTSLLKRETAHSIKGLDGVVNDFDGTEYLKEVEKFAPDIVVAELTTISIKSDMWILSSLKDRYGCIIILTGNYPTIAYKEILEKYKFVDICVRGEYEYIVLDIVRSLESNKLRKEVRGIAYIDNGVLIETPARPVSKDEFAGLPWPDREDFPATLYPDFTIYAPCVSMTATRGCPSNCIYCQERHIMYNSPMYRMRPPEDVVNEMFYLRDRFHARQLYFDDMTLVANNDNVQSICKLIIDRKLGIPWTCMGDVMFVKDETLELMAKAGCIGMKFGVETANAEMLKTIGKPLDLNKVRSKVRLCKKLGIKTHATYVIGLPGETEETIKNTYDFMIELDSYTSQIAKAVPYPGTPFYKWAEENGYMKITDLEELDGMGKIVLKYNNLSLQKIDMWYDRFCKTIARKKLLNFLMNPVSSGSILLEFIKGKGFVSSLNSIITVIRRGI